MKSEIEEKLIEINRNFYREHAVTFSATRGRVQPGVERALETIDLAGDLLDVGCGNGSVARYWLEKGKAKGLRNGSYTGLDFSPPLLADAHLSSTGVSDVSRSVQFFQADLSQPDWPAGLPKSKYSTITAFAVLHHIPGEARRLQLLRAIRSLLEPEGVFILSVWQFQNSWRFASRITPWEDAGLSAGEVDSGDYLIQWRPAGDPAGRAQAYRYVHIFTTRELQELSGRAGFHIVDSFPSDGEGNRLGLYQTWEKRNKPSAWVGDAAPN